jgi:hypothetical protein
MFAVILDIIEDRPAVRLMVFNDFLSSWIDGEISKLREMPPTNLISERTIIQAHGLIRIMKLL